MQLDHPSGAYVKVIADSITTDSMGEPRRLFTVEVKHHRFVLAELATHDGSIARNSASSRAIPFPKMLEKFWDDPAIPVEWPAEQAGMMGGELLEGYDLLRAQRLWHILHEDTYNRLSEYLEDSKDLNRPRLHKSLLNRWLEPALWHTTLLTGVYWQNFFNQRDDKAAMPELRIIAEMIHQAYDTHIPTVMWEGQWHLPYLDSTVTSQNAEDGHCYDLREISTSRCAQTSYASAGSTDFSVDQKRYDEKLLPGKHMSCFEHPATPKPLNVHSARLTDPDNGRTLGFRVLPKFGRFPGWMCWRHVVEGRMGHVSTQ